jgi:hypothetical protein
MTKLFVASAALLAACSSFGQGLITFGNRVGSINAPVTFLGDQRPGNPLGAGASLASGANFLAQLAVNGTPVGTPVQFRTGAAAGYLSNTVVDAGVAGGTSVTVTMLAWAADLGATYAQAVARGIGGHGTSGNLTISPIAPPGTPADLVGLQPFNISVIVPEPGVATLGLLGAGLLLFRRKK